MDVISFLIWLLVALPLVYLYLVALASFRMSQTQPSASPRTKFAIAIPAHNEETVIARTITTLRQIDYPAELIDIFVVADHCTDQTAANARAASAITYARDDGPRGGKGAALSWLFERIFSGDKSYDAVVVFDADTIVDPKFLRLMDARLQAGARVVQGNHRIINPQDAWFAALTWAMFIVDNRFQNHGRANLGWSAKNMGDSICFRADILRQLGWGEGLTEDYEFRQRLLLQDIKIQYEPAAMGYGEAAISWEIARAQRARWLGGTYRASRQYARDMLKEGMRRCDAALLDGAAQAYLPSYSTLTLISVAVLAAHLLLASWFSSWVVWLWLLLTALFAIYPLIGLLFERAPARAYLAIWLGPVFIIWRTWLSATARFGRKNIVWVRTARREDVQADGAKK
jgi:cellulose synthase/poly-beta-1,6-N-acetylglucosamine synthase-like glycosyltransferase